MKASQPNNGRNVEKSRHKSRPPLQLVSDNGFEDEEPDGIAQIKTHGEGAENLAPAMADIQNVSSVAKVALDRPTSAASSYYSCDSTAQVEETFQLQTLSADIRKSGKTRSRVKVEKSIGRNATELQTRPPHPSDSFSTAQIVSSTAADHSSRIPWAKMHASNIPSDAYQVHASGRIFCKHCRAWFNSFHGFRRHFQEAPIHRATYSDSVHETLPTLVRSTSPGPSTPVRSDSSVYRGTREKPPPQSRQTHFPPFRDEPAYCRVCHLQFRNTVALQRHMACELAKHPYYCTGCAVEFDEFHTLQLVRKVASLMLLSLG